MLETSARLLRLLSLLQARPFWKGDELVERLGVTDRTLRRDVTRLRELGYPIDAETGKFGGYRLGAGGSLPPLLLDDDEAVAVAIGLRTAASGTVMGLEEAAVAALAKLEQVLPAALHHQVMALSAATIPLTEATPHVMPASLLAIAQASRGLERLKFTYRDRSDRVTERTVEPYRLVHTGRRWYLVARDVRKAEWRTFRVDRMVDPVGTGHRFTIEDPPDAVALVTEGVAVSVYRIKAVVHVHAPPAEVAHVVPRSTAVLEDGPDGGTMMTMGADEADWVVRYLAGLPWTFTVIEPAAVRDGLRELAQRLLDANLG